MALMARRSFFGRPRADGADPGRASVDMLAGGEDAPPPDLLRAEAMQRLQVGLIGIAAMVLLVGLASIIGSQADLADQAAVPEAAPTTEPVPVPSQANPLADAGVVPDIAAEPSPSPTVPLVVPPQPAPLPRAAPGTGASNVEPAD